MDVLRSSSWAMYHKVDIKSAEAGLVFPTNNGAENRASKQRAAFKNNETIL